MSGMTSNPPKPRRRWLQFSLRTLLVVVTVFCIWMWIATKRAREQRWAVEAILKAGGTVAYRHEYFPMSPYPPSDPPGPDWLRQWFGNEYFFSVAKVDVRLRPSEINDLILDDVILDSIAR